MRKNSFTINDAMRLAFDGVFPADETKDKIDVRIFCFIDRLHCDSDHWKIFSITGRTCPGLEKATSVDVGGYGCTVIES